MAIGDRILLSDLAICVGILETASTHLAVQLVLLEQPQCVLTQPWNISAGEDFMPGKWYRRVEINKGQIKQCRWTILNDGVVPTVVLTLDKSQTIIELALPVFFFPNVLDIELFNKFKPNENYRKPICPLFGAESVQMLPFLVSGFQDKEGKPPTPGKLYYTRIELSFSSACALPIWKYGKDYNGLVETFKWPSVCAAEDSLYRHMFSCYSIDFMTIDKFSVQRNGSGQYFCLLTDKNGALALNVGKRNRETWIGKRRKYLPIKINSFNFPLIYALDCPEIFMGEQEERAKLHLKKMENDKQYQISFKLDQHFLAGNNLGSFKIPFIGTVMDPFQAIQKFIDGIKPCQRPNLQIITQIQFHMDRAVATSMAIDCQLFEYETAWIGNAVLNTNSSFQPEVSSSSYYVIKIDAKSKQSMGIAKQLNNHFYPRALQNEHKQHFANQASEKYQRQRHPSPSFRKFSTSPVLPIQKKSTFSSSSVRVDEPMENSRPLKMSNSSGQYSRALSKNSSPSTNSMYMHSQIKSPSPQPNGLQYKDKEPWPKWYQQKKPLNSDAKFPIKTRRVISPSEIYENYCNPIIESKPKPEANRTSPPTIRSRTPFESEHGSYQSLNRLKSSNSMNLNKLDHDNWPKSSPLQQGYKINHESRPKQPGYQIRSDAGQNSKILKSNQNCHSSTAGGHRKGHSSEDGHGHLLYGQMPITLAPQIHTNFNPKKQAPEVKSLGPKVSPISLDYPEFVPQKVPERFSPWGDSSGWEIPEDTDEAHKMRQNVQNDMDNLDIGQQSNTGSSNSNTSPIEDDVKKSNEPCKPKPAKAKSKWSKSQYEHDMTDSEEEDDENDDDVDAALGPSAAPALSASSSSSMSLDLAEAGSTNTMTESPQDELLETEEQIENAGQQEKRNDSANANANVQEAMIVPMKPTNGHIPSFGGFGYSRRQRSQEEQYQNQKLPNLTNNYNANVANISTTSKDESSSKNLIETLLSSADKIAQQFGHLTVIDNPKGDDEGFSGANLTNEGNSLKPTFLPATSHHFETSADEKKTNDFVAAAMDAKFDDWNDDADFGDLSNETMEEKVNEDEESLQEDEEEHAMKMALKEAQVKSQEFWDEEEADDLGVEETGNQEYEEGEVEEQLNNGQEEYQFQDKYEADLDDPEGEDAQCYRSYNSDA